MVCEKAECQNRSLGLATSENILNILKIDISYRKVKLQKITDILNISKTSNENLGMKKLIFSLMLRLVTV